MVRTGSVGATHITTASALTSNRRATLLLAAALGGWRHRQGGPMTGSPLQPFRAAWGGSSHRTSKGVRKAQAEPANDPSTHCVLPMLSLLYVLLLLAIHSFIHSSRGGGERKGTGDKTEARAQGPKRCFCRGWGGAAGGKGEAVCPLGEGDRSGGQSPGPGGSVLESKDHRGHQCGFPHLKEAFIGFVWILGTKSRD